MANSTIGARLKLIRKTLKLTQQAFANELGIDQGHVGNMERGSRKPSESLIRHICLRFHVSEIWIKTGQGIMFISAAESIQKQIAHYGKQAILNAVLDNSSENKQNFHQDTKPQEANNDINEATYNHARRQAKSDNKETIVDFSNLPDPVYTQIMRFLVDIWERGDQRLIDWAIVQCELAFPDLRTTCAPQGAKRPDLARIMIYLNNIFRSDNQRLKNWVIIQFENTFPNYVLQKKENAG